MEILGTIGNDTLIGTDDPDVIFTKGGLDNVQAGGGDDEIVLEAAVGSGSVLNGGLGFDTLVLKPQEGIPYFNGGTQTEYYTIHPTQLISIEAVRFDSQPGDFLDIVMLDFQRAGAGLTTIIGGGGRDIFYNVVFNPGTYTMPELTFVNWNTDLLDPNNDFVVLLAPTTSTDNFTLNAREGLASIQGLRGALGNDILNGSSGSDSLDGRSGVNQLYGNGGDDWLFAENYTPFGGVAATNTFAGDIFDGGGGTDSLLVGGPVNFQGTLSGIEQIYFQPARLAPAPGISGLGAAHLTLTADRALAMGANQRLNGVGTLQIDLAFGQTFSAMGYSFGANAAVDIAITGSTGNETIDGSDGDDTIDGGEGDDTLRGMGGADALYGGLGADTLIGGTSAASGPQSGDGADLLDGGSGNDILRGGDGDDTLLGGADNDNLRGDAGADALDGGDGFDFAGYLYSDLSDPVNIDMRGVISSATPQLVDDGRGSFDLLSNIEKIGISGTEAGDTLLGSLTLDNQLYGWGGDDSIEGGAAADFIDGGAGADTINGRGGIDEIHGGDGDDEIVLDKKLDFGSTVDGGNGYDTVVLRPQELAPYVNGGTSTQYDLYYPSTPLSLEAVRFESRIGDWLGIVVVENQRAAAGLNTLIGGAGRDAMYSVVFTPGTYTMPELTLVNWNTDIRDPNFDYVTLFASNSGNYVLNAREGFTGVQGLQGNGGNDTLNGSSGSDALGGGSGVDLLYGNGGDDLLMASNYTPYGGTASTQTFAGSAYFGGSGEDSLVVGGHVDFQGTISEIENIYFEAGFAAPRPGSNGLEAGYLILSASNALTLPSNAKINGNGTLVINMGSETSFNASGFQIGSGYSIAIIINGSSLADDLRGTSTSDTIDGGDGDDTLRGMGGADTLYGGLGADVLLGGTSAFSGPQPGDGADLLDGGAGNDLLRGGDGDDTLLGGADNDNLRGDAGADSIDGGDGQDFVSYLFSDLVGPVTIDMRAVTNSATQQLVDDGRGSFDLVSNIEKIGIAGTEANDTLRGSLALDNQLYGNGGVDLIRGGNTTDFIDGGADNDDIRGQGGADEIYGGDGNDSLAGGFNTASVQPQAGDLADYIDGGAGNDVIRGGDGDDVLIGGVGDDNLRGDAGNDTMNGGEGFDFASYRFDDLADARSIDIRGLVASEDPQLFDDGRGGLDTLISIESIGIAGSAGDDLILGSIAMRNQLGGNLGNDTIVGGNADDFLSGDAGNDTMDGGAGIDVANYLGVLADFEIVALTNGQWQVTDLNAADGDEGIDVVTHVEVLQFAGQQLVTLNQAPTADDHAVVLDEDQSVSGSVAGSDPEGDPLTFVLVDGPAHGTLTFDAAGQYNYVPDADFFGVDSFTFTANDALFASNVGTVTIAVNPVADAAVIGGDLLGDLTEGVIVGAAAGQIGGSITVNDVDGPAAMAPQTANGTYGSFQLEANGSWLYTLAETSTAVQSLNTGTTVTDSFTVASNDGTTQTVTIAIRGANDAAVIGGAVTGTVQESALVGAASQVAGALTVSDVDSPASFVAGNQTGLYGSLTLTASGGWTYVLNNTNSAVDGLSLGETLTESFTVAAADGTAQTISLIIAGADDLRTGSNQVDNLVGTAGNDTLTGNGGNDTLNGGLGNDTLDGGGGNGDTASYAGLGAGVQVSLAIVGPQATGAGGTDTLIGIENLAGTGFDDVLTGSAAANLIEGGAGNDLIDGGAGNDTLNGGLGVDTVSYASATSAVTVSLATTSSQNTSGAGGDSLIGFENLSGSGFADRLTGSSTSNAIDGGAGNDRIIGGGGADTLTGGSGTDTFAFAALADSTVLARDTILDFEGAGAAGGDLIDLSAIDALPGGKDNAFTFVLGAGPLLAGQVQVIAAGTDQWRVVAAVAGSPNIEILVHSATALTAADFML